MLLLLLFYWDYYVHVGFALAIFCVALWFFLWFVEFVANFLHRFKSKGK